MSCKFDEEWATIHCAVTKLVRIIEELPEPSFTAEEYMRFYTTVYNICNQSSGCENLKLLYAKYRKVYEDYIASTVLPFLREKQGEFLLREFVKRWENHKIMMRWLCGFFEYLERHYICRSSVLPTLRDVGIICFRDMVHVEIKARVTDVMIGMIEKDRKGDKRVDVLAALLKNVVNVFVEVGMGELENYEQDFEADMLEDTSKHYSRRATSWIVQDSCPNYMVKTEECLRREKERVSRYLHLCSEKKLVERVEHELLVVYEKQLLEKEDSGFVALLRNDKIEDLSRMFKLYREIPEGLEPIAKMFKQFIANRGTMLIDELQTEDDATAFLVMKIIQLRDKYMTYVNGCFEDHYLFQRALKEAFEAFCNKAVAGNPSIAELFSAFCDEMLRKGGASEKLSEGKIEENLEKVVKLLACVKDKDVFAEFYKKKLCCRLLFAKSASQEHEKYSLMKLKQQYGPQFTSKMEAMLMDMARSKETQTDFKSYLQDHPDENTHGIDLSVTVLTTTSWPTFKSLDVNIPDEMLKSIQAFNKFCKTRTQNRKLTWVHSQGTCNIHGKFQAKTIELIMSTYQAVVLLLFNSSDRLTYSEIRAVSNIDDEYVIRLLDSLSCSKYKILKKTPTPSTETVSANDVFEFNSRFNGKLRRIMIPLPMQQVTKERKKAAEQVDKDRRYTIDAAIVRIMKSRKVLGYQQLVIECVELLRPMFMPDIKAIKKRIEDLISRDYLERQKDDPNTFMYIA